MSAAELRQAAETLRGRARAASDGPWVAGERCVWDDLEVYAVISVGFEGDGGVDTQETACYIATMHPGVGLALAEWLDGAAVGACCDECMDDPDADPLRYGALTVARLINGGAA